MKGRTVNIFPFVGLNSSARLNPSKPKKNFNNVEEGSQSFYNSVKTQLMKRDKIQKEKMQK